MKEEEKIKMIKANALKKAARMNQHGKSFAKIFEGTAKILNDMVASEDPSTPFLQILLSLSTNIIKDSYQHIGGKMGHCPDQNKLTVVAAIVQKWGERT